MNKQELHYAKITVNNRHSDQLWDLLELEALKACKNCKIELIDNPEDRLNARIKELEEVCKTALVAIGHQGIKSSIERSMGICGVDEGDFALKVNSIKGVDTEKELEKAFDGLQNILNKGQ